MPKTRPPIAYTRHHAPHYFYATGPLCEADPLVPMAKANGEPVNCPVCRRLLRDRPQWLNQLLERGYKVTPAPVRLRKATKPDPRQVNFREMFDDDE